MQKYANLVELGKFAKCWCLTDARAPAEVPHERRALRPVRRGARADDGAELRGAGRPVRVAAALPSDRPRL